MRAAYWLHSDRARVITQAATATPIVYAAAYHGTPRALSLLLMAIAAIFIADVAWTLATHANSHDPCDTHIEWLEAEIERTELETTEVTEEMQGQVDKLTDEHAYLSSEVERLTDRLAEAEPAA